MLSTRHHPSQTRTRPLSSPKSSGRQLGGSCGYFKYLMTLCVVKHYLEFGKSGFCSSLCLRDRLCRTHCALGVLSPRLGGGRSARPPPAPAPLPAPRGRPRGGHRHGWALRGAGGCGVPLPGRAGRERAPFNRGAGRTTAPPGAASTRRGGRRPGGAVPRPRPAARELRRPGLQLLRPSLRGASCSRPGPGRGGGRGAGGPGLARAQNRPRRPLRGPGPSPAARPRRRPSGTRRSPRPRSGRTSWRCGGCGGTARSRWGREGPRPALTTPHPAPPWPRPAPTPPCPTPAPPRPRPALPLP